MRYMLRMFTLLLALLISLLFSASCRRVDIEDIAPQNAEKEMENLVDSEKFIVKPSLQIDDTVYTISDDRLGNELPVDIINSLDLYGHVELFTDSFSSVTENLMSNSPEAEIGDSIYIYIEETSKNIQVFVFNESSQRWFQYSHP